MAGLDFIVQPGGCLRGDIRIPGDKSISHRFVMLAAIANGESSASGFLHGEDTLATVAALRAMGVHIEGPQDGRLSVRGVGSDGLTPPAASLDMGNSGTAMRLLCGLLAGQRFDSVLHGDASLNQRPMARVIDPLTVMGARIDSAEGGRPPLSISGREQNLKAIDYALPMASAQVKSCLLLAGLYARGEITITEPAPTRDHTERMLRSFGVPVSVNGRRISMSGGARLTAQHIDIPADISSAAFFMAGACIARGSSVMLRQVGINPSRTGVLQVLKRMGADITASNEHQAGGEQVADLRITHRPLQGIEIPRSVVPLAIDEFPALMVVAAFAEGKTTLRGARELRVKESDRIASVTAGLRELGVTVEEYDDGLCVHGGRVHGGSIDSHGDHRIAMAFTMAGFGASDSIRIKDCANVNTSFPGFAELASECGLTIHQQPLSSP